MDERDDLVASILRATSGSPCRAAEERLPDLVDGVLDTVDDALVHEHLQTCAPCSLLSRALAETARVLPELAEVDPGRAFTEAVLARTSRTPVSRWAAAFQALLLRPRFALEGAYLGALVLVGVLALPGLPLRALPARASQAVVRTAGVLDARALTAWTGAEQAASKVATRAAELKDGTERKADALLVRIGWKDAKEENPKEGKETP
jgi:hypothetical protein